MFPFVITWEPGNDTGRWATLGPKRGGCLWNHLAVSSSNTTWRKSVKWAGRAGLSAAFWAGRGCSVLYLTEGEKKKILEIVCIMGTVVVCGLWGWGFFSLSLTCLFRRSFINHSFLKSRHQGTATGEYSFAFKKASNKNDQMYLMGCWNSIMPASYVIVAPNDFTKQRAGRDWLGTPGLCHYILLRHKQHSWTATGRMIFNAHLYILTLSGLK